jgi:hypothetical protein
MQELPFLSGQCPLISANAVSAAAARDHQQPGLLCHLTVFFLSHDNRADNLTYYTIHANKGLVFPPFSESGQGHILIQNADAISECGSTHSFGQYTDAKHAILIPEQFSHYFLSANSLAISGDLSEEIPPHDPKEFLTPQTSLQSSRLSYEIAPYTFELLGKIP